MITTTITLALKNGQKIELTEAEARQLSAELLRLFPVQPPSYLLGPLKRDAEAPFKSHLREAFGVVSR